MTNSNQDAYAVKVALPAAQLMRSAIANDDKAQAIVDSANTHDLISGLVGLAIQFGAKAYGSTEQLDAFLSALIDDALDLKLELREQTEDNGTE
jgi:hypothetical protein